MNLEIFSFNTGLISLGLSIVLGIFQIILTRYFFRQKFGNSRKVAKSEHISSIIVTSVTIFSFLFITISIISRAVKTGHGPFSSMYEFTLAFTWGILIMALAFSWKYRNMTIKLGGNVISFVLLFFASTLSSKAAPLIPALQNIFLLSFHVASAVVAYGAFTISFISAIYYMIQKDDRYTWLPPSKSLEDISYHAVIIGFPFMTLVIILGAIWADIAWGSYWSWDPKETASLVTWLIYAGYLHARVVGKWKGKKTALIIIIGFIAVIFTFFGNYIFSGLHSYN